MIMSFFYVQDNYLQYFANLVKKATPLKGADAVVKANELDGDVRIQYEDQPEFENIARQFGVFEEWKVCKCAYRSNRLICVKLWTGLGAFSLCLSPPHLYLNKV